MNHNIIAEGFGVRLRPVQTTDAAFIVWLRNLDHVKGRVGDSAVDVKKQEAWLEVYFQRAGDYYFLLETERKLPLGTYSLYDMANGSAESGRWIINPQVPAALPCAVLGLDTAFNVLRLRELRTTTVSTNQRVLSLNRKFGFRQVRVDAAAQVIGGQPVDLVRFVLMPEEWPAVRARLVPHALVAEKQVREWEQAELLRTKQP